MAFPWATYFDGLRIHTIYNGRCPVEVTRTEMSLTTCICHTALPVTHTAHAIIRNIIYIYTYIYLYIRNIIRNIIRSIIKNINPSQEYNKEYKEECNQGVVKSNPDWSFSKASRLQAYSLKCFNGVFFVL